MILTNVPNSSLERNKPPHTGARFLKKGTSKAVRNGFSGVGLRRVLYPDVAMDDAEAELPETPSGS